MPPTPVHTCSPYARHTTSLSANGTYAARRRPTFLPPSRSVRGRVLCAMSGVVTDAEPIEVAAAHSVWYVLCKRESHTEVAVKALVEGLVLRDSEAAAATMSVFAAGRRKIEEIEWRVSHVTCVTCAARVQRV